MFYQKNFRIGRIQKKCSYKKERGNTGKKKVNELKVRRTPKEMYQWRVNLEKKV